MVESSILSVTAVELSDFSILKIYLFLFHMYECLSAYIMCVPDTHLPRLQEAIESPGTGVRKDSQPPYGFWEPNPGPLSARAVNALNH